MLFRSEAFSAIGGFDEGYHLYIEDVDICTRLRLAGWTLRQCPGASVIHDARKQSHRSLKFTRWHIAGMLRYWFSRSFWRYRSLLKAKRRAGYRGAGDAS
jgi:GT2 family glycosyltransferase